MRLTLLYCSNRLKVGAKVFFRAFFSLTSSVNASVMIELVNMSLFVSSLLFEQRQRLIFTDLIKGHVLKQEQENSCMIVTFNHHRIGGPNKAAVRTLPYMLHARQHLEHRLNLLLKSKTLRKHRNTFTLTF